ncbi:energy-coupling factor transporter ATP-binding protein EcfA2 [Rathayibacter agropyri]
MSLNEELATWVAMRPDWQKHAVARFCRNEMLTTEDVAAIADQLIVGSYPAASNIAPDDVPGSITAGDPVTLSRVSGVAGVNALLADQMLAFGASGLTIIFGNNGSGKSGYARLVREAVTARVKSDGLLGDVFSERNIPQTATLDYRVGASTAKWSLGDSQSLDLSRIRFYDEHCGDAYVTKASEATYKPSVLTILDQLSNVCEALAEELARRLVTNHSAWPHLPALHPDTAAARFLSTLSASTTEAEINAAITIESNHEAELAKLLAEENRLKGSNLNKEKVRFATLSRDWSTLEAHSKVLYSALNAEALQELSDQIKEADQLREAARIASSRTFDSEPLSGVGSGTWRALWDAAREFSLIGAYHDHDYPFVDDGAVCVLCQQPLSPEGADRLSRFESFVSDTTSREADDAALALSISRDRLAHLRTLPLAVTASTNRLQEDGEHVQTALEWLEEATRSAANAVEWVDGSEEAKPKPIVDSVSTAAAARAHSLTEIADDIDAPTFSQTLAAIGQRVMELQDAKVLSEARSAIESEVVRLAERKQIEDVRRLAATNSITRKRSELVETYVTQEVRDQFTRETEWLDLRRVTLNRTGRGRDSVLEHQPSLLGSRRDAIVDKVLSEGEQTALGLAGFLTEVELDASLSGVVFDDPVCSLDAGRRSKVAQRLIELARQRQVIVFTHEITFVHSLNQEAKRGAVPVESRSIQRMGDSQPGLVTNQLPWSAKDIPLRIDRLESDLICLKKERPGLTDDQYVDQIGILAGRLSETLERTVNLHIVNELVDRGTNEVRPTMLKILPKFTQADHDEYQASYAKTSSWAVRHDNAPEENYVPPTIDEVELEVAWLRSWFGRVKKYAN